MSTDYIPDENIPLADIEKFTHNLMAVMKRGGKKLADRWRRQLDGDSFGHFT